MEVADHGGTGRIPTNPNRNTWDGPPRHDDADAVVAAHQHAEPRASAAHLSGAPIADAETHSGLEWTHHSSPWCSPPHSRRPPRFPRVWSRSGLKWQRCSHAARPEKEDSCYSTWCGRLVWSWRCCCSSPGQPFRREVCRYRFRMAFFGCDTNSSGWRSFDTVFLLAFVFNHTHARPIQSTVPTNLMLPPQSATRLFAKTRTTDRVS
jgi:hypothetical protein